MQDPTRPSDGDPGAKVIVVAKTLRAVADGVDVEGIKA
jgi:hypothetical protein